MCSSWLHSHAPQRMSRTHHASSDLPTEVSAYVRLCQYQTSTQCSHVVCCYAGGSSLHQGGQSGSRHNPYAAVLAASAVSGNLLPGGVLGGCGSISVQRQRHRPSAAAALHQRHPQSLCEPFHSIFCPCFNVWEHLGASRVTPTWFELLRASVRFPSRRLFTDDSRESCIAT